MQLYLDSFGAFLAVRDGRFAVRTQNRETRLFAVREVGAILLTRGVSLSADAALLAADNDIPLLLIDAQTHFPLAQLGSGRAGSIAAVRRRQAFWSHSAAGYAWMAGAIAEKIVRQRQVLEGLAEHEAAPPGFAAESAPIRRMLAGLADQFGQWSPPAAWTETSRQQAAEQFRGQEGTASRVYFQHLGRWLAARGVDFPGRQQRPAFDPFNTLLNYAYGMLYTAVHLGLLKNGLDPFMGVLHADQWGDRPTLAFDAIEPYRPWADAVALRLAADGALDVADAFQPDPDERGLWLAPAGKDRLIDAMLACLQEKMPYDHRQVRRAARIDLDLQALKTRIAESGEP